MNSVRKTVLVGFVAVIMLLIPVYLVPVVFNVDSYGEFYTSNLTYALYAGIYHIFIKATCAALIVGVFWIFSPKLMNSKYLTIGVPILAVFSMVNGSIQDVKKFSELAHKEVISGKGEKYIVSIKRPPKTLNSNQAYCLIGVTSDYHIFYSKFGKENVVAIPNENISMLAKLGVPK